MRRVIVPLYHLTTQGRDFTYTGEYRGVKCKISVPEYELEGGPPNTIIPEEPYRELTSYASEEGKHRLRDMHRRSGNPFMPPTKSRVLLIIDAQTPELHMLRELCVQSLLLHTTKGALIYDYFDLNSDVPSSGYGVPLRTANRFPPLMSDGLIQPSEFLESEFDNCSKTLQVLLSDDWRRDTQYRRVLKLALMYYLDSLKVERGEVAYMMLAIAFEAMFKAKNEKHPIAIKRLSLLLGESVKHSKQIVRSLEKGITKYSTFRDAIAHGDTAYDENSVGNAYKMFYPLVRKSIIALIQINNESITEVADPAAYYTNLNSYLQGKFSSD